MKHARDLMVKTGELKDGSFIFVCNRCLITVRRDKDSKAVPYCDGSDIAWRARWTRDFSQ